MTDAEVDMVQKVKSVLITEEGVYPRVTIIRRTTEPLHPPKPSVLETPKVTRRLPKTQEVLRCSVHWVDGLARFLFPCCYVIFLMVFWGRYRESFQ